MEIDLKTYRIHCHDYARFYLSLNNYMRDNDEERLKRKINATGCVSLSTSHKFRAMIPPSWTDGKKGYLGSFDTQEEAWSAIAEYKAEHVDS